MTRGGHVASSLMTASAAGAWLWHGQPVAAACLLIGSLAGANAPDWIERPLDIPIVRHRTWGHWPGWWCGVTLSGVVAQRMLRTVAPLSAPAAWALVGLGAAALLHVLIDTGSPMGVPWGWPPRYRRSAERNRHIGPFKLRRTKTGRWTGDIYNTGDRIGEAAVLSALGAVCLLVGSSGWYFG